MRESPCSPSAVAGSGHCPGRAGPDRGRCHACTAPTHRAPGLDEPPACPLVIDLRDRPPLGVVPPIPTVRRQTVELRRGLLYLVRLALDEDWSLERSAERLRRAICDERVLRVLRARVWRADQQRSTLSSSRMLATIEAALASDGRRRMVEHAAPMPTAGRPLVALADDRVRP